MKRSLSLHYSLAPCRLADHPHPPVVFAPDTTIHALHEPPAFDIAREERALQEYRRRGARYLFGEELVEYAPEHLPCCHGHGVAQSVRTLPGL